MAKQLNVNLAFTADTGAAKAQMMDLQRTLQSIAINPTSFGGEKLTAEILEASKAAAQLSVQLKNATNVDTGTLDFSKLNQSMQKSGQTLASYGDKLMKLGPQGQEAFMKITSAVAKAEVPFRRSNKLVTEMWTTLKNTARWQLSSSILHGFMGALQSAYGYAQDLNESLNDIRIVTGYTTDQMADFAKQANASAKALSTTTNEYVKASLIYYQQGLSGKEIEERTNITIKMANVTKQSAQVVSDQLTAIWNNFDDGTKSLESYADAITALGAATASSTDEIAEGLEKFAAIADTVGLSFEYATSALATVTAETRQSADVVGTAFKTLFARLQDLELGKTLDDGTSLGKYSAAMAAVGVNIKDASGGLKDMDAILDELGGRWKALSKDQQVALAQTVAGTRQYSQLIALMDNWDTMQANLKTVEQSEGTIDLQHEKYAEGWEAASKRVRAALESIYEKLLDDDAFIGLLNGLEDIIGKVDFLVERLGGMKGTLTMLGALITQIFSKQISGYLNELGLQLQTMTKKGQKHLQEKKFEQMDSAKDTMVKYAQQNESVDVAQSISTVYTRRVDLQKLLLKNAEKFNDEERETLQLILDQNDALGQQVIDKQKAVDSAKEKRSDTSTGLYAKAAAASIKEGKTFDSSALAASLKVVRETTQAQSALQTALKETSVSSAKVTEQFTKLKQLGVVNDDDIAAIEMLVKKLEKADLSAEDYEATLGEIAGKMKAIQQQSKDTAAETLGLDLDDIDEYADSIEGVADAEAELAQATKNFEDSADSLEQDLEKGGVKTIDWGQKIVSTANAIMSVSSAISMLQSAWDTLSDPETTAWERLSTVFTTIAMVIPTLIMAWKSLSEVLNKETLATMASAIAKLFKAKASREAASASSAEANASNEAAKAQAKETATDVADGVVDTVKKGKGKGNKIFKGNSGDRWFANKYDKQGRPLDQNGQIIGKDNYAKAGLDDTGKLIKNKKSGFKLFGKGAGKAGGKAAAKAGGQAATQAATTGGSQAATTAAAGGLKGIVAAAAPVAAIAAGVAIIAGTIALVVHQTQKWEKAAQEAEKRAVQAAEAYQSVADAYNEFSSTLDNYSNARKGLEELTKGTKEYQQAVIEANESAMALIEAHEGLAYSVNNEGLIEIDQESLEAAEKEKLDNMQKAQMNKQMMAIEAREKRIKADSVELQRKELDSSQGTWTAIGNVAASTAAGAGGGALIGAGVGSLAAGVGAAPGAAIGAIAGAITGLVSGIVAQASIGTAAEREQEAIDKVTALDATAFASKEEYIKAIDSLDINDEGLKKSLKENYDAMKELAAEVRANEAATAALNKQMVAAAVQDNEVVQNGRHTEDVVAAAATFFEEDESAAMDKLIDDGWGTKGISKATKVNDEVERVFAEYAEAAGLEGAKVTDTTGTDKNRKFIYEIDGKEVEVSLEEMRTMVAKQKAAEASGLKAEQLTEIYNKLNDAEAGAVTAAMTGDTSGLNLKQLQGEAITADSLGLSAEDLKVMGYESADAFNAAMKTAQEKAAKGWEITLSNYSDTTEKLMRQVGNSSNEALQNISQASVKAYGNMLEAIESAGGSDAAEAMSEGLMGLMEQHSAKAEEIMNAAASIDWSKGEASLNELNGKLFDMGIYIDENSEEWKAMVKSMEQINTSVVHRDLDSIRQDIVSIKEIAGNIEMGSVISDEDYQRLVKYNGALKHMFAMTADGYMYVGGGNLEEEANKAALEQLQKTREDNAKAKAAHSALNNWGWVDGSGKWTKEDWYGLANGTDSDTSMISMTNALIENEGDHLASLGFDAGYLAEMTKTLGDANATDDQKNKAREQLQKVYGEILALNTNMQNGAYDDKKAEEVYASTLTSIDELKKAQKDNVISKETYNKYIKVLVRQEMQNAEDLQSLEDAYKAGGTAGKSGNLEAYRENLQRLGEGYATAAEELEAYQKAIESGSNIRGAEQALKNAITLGETAEEFGVNAEELEQLTHELMQDSNMGFQNALDTAVGYIKLAEEFGLSTEELKTNLSTLTSSFSDLSTKETDALFKDIASAAQEAGLSITELTNQTAELGTRFGVTGQEALEMATMFAQASSEYGISSEELAIQAQNIAQEYGVSATAAARLAVQNQRMNQGVASLTENWQDWKKALTTTSKTSTDYAKAMAGLTDTVRDLVGAGEDFVLTSEFVEENMELIEAAANGDEKAINMLGVATAKASVSAMEFSQEFADAMAKASRESGVDSPFEHLSRSFEENKAIVQSGITELMDAVANGTLKVGDSMSFLGDDWISALNEMAIQTGMSVEEMNSLLNQMGVDADVQVTEVPTKTKVPVYRTEEEVISDGSNGPKVTETKTSVTRYEEMDGMIQVASINSDAAVTYTGNGSVSSSSKTSGGGSTSKPAKAEKKQTKDRYMKVTEQLGDTANAMADANREMDSLYGAGRIAQMSKVNKLLNDEIGLLEDKTAEAKEYLKTDKEAMLNAFKDAGVKNLSFDENGNVSNIEDALGGLDSEYNAMVDNYNRMAKNFYSDEVISTNEQKQLDEYKAKMDEKAATIDAAKAAYDQYADTLNVIEETEDQIAEKQNEIKANNYQKMVDNLNLALEGTTARTQEIDYYLNKIADDFYKMAEAAALTGSKMDVATEVLALQKQHADGLAEAYAKGNITQADYVAGLQESRDAIYGELESLQSLDKEMQDYYGNTLSAAGEELSKYTERMDHLNSVLDHYQSLLTTIGKETDYKSMGVVLQGIADGAENSLEVAKAEYAFYAGEAEKKKALMESVPKDSAAFEVYKKEWEAAEAATREAQDRMLSATAEWAESMKAVLTNELSDFASTLEQQLTGGTSFDEMTTSLERAASLQEDYLTTTNQIYETTKMMRTAERALDETTSVAAKNKLKGFIETTKQLQNQEKLSKFELDMQQKKYDLLLAEIALEEAQNAKSTVRLQRNADGGFGYVYTADSNQVADAQQRVDDAQNALYNAGLEGANDFAQKQAQITQEGADAMQALTDALANGEISLEDWQRRTAETQAYYAQKLQDYSSLYQVAISADSAIMQEAWSADYAAMLTDAETWSASMDEYLAGCEGSFQKWQTVVEEVQSVVGSNYTEIAENVESITTANDELTEEILKDGGVIDTIGSEVEAVSGVTEAYANKRQAILDLIATNEAYIKSLNDVIAAESGKATVGDTSDDVTTVTTTTTTTETPPEFDSGGYTGEWGPSGKLAVLHEKEIVLNAADTKNLLSIVEMIRAIDMHSMSAQIGGILSTPGFHGGDSGTLEQNVKIEASFPNVQDRNEIEEAFNNLINRASQYANR